MPADLDSVATELADFIRKEFLDGDPSAELTAATPLLGWGILNSMNTAYLATFIGTRYEVTVPPSSVTAANFRDIKSISAMIEGLREGRDALG